MLCIVFILQRLLCHLSAIMTVTIIHTVVNDQCRLVNTHEPQTGHRCVTASESYIIIPNVPSHLCSHICMQRGSCNVINYNHEKGYCQLMSEKCRKIIKDPDFDFMVVDDMCISCDTKCSLFVSRLVRESSILVESRYLPNKLYFCLEKWVAELVSFSYYQRGTHPDDALVLNKLGSLCPWQWYSRRCCSWGKLGWPLCRDRRDLWLL